jgi:hypothetical protein
MISYGCSVAISFKIYELAVGAIYNMCTNDFISYFNNSDVHDYLSFHWYPLDIGQLLKFFSFRF